MEDEQKHKNYWPRARRDMLLRLLESSNTYSNLFLEFLSAFHISVIWRALYTTACASNTEAYTT